MARTKYRGKPYTPKNRWRKKAANTMMGIGMTGIPYASYIGMAGAAINTLGAAKDFYLGDKDERMSEFRMNAAIKEAERRRAAKLTMDINPRTGGLMNLETKYIDVSVVPQVVTEAWVTVGTHLAPVTQGTGATQRNGRFITMIELAIRGAILMDPYQDSIKPLVTRRVRMMVVLDTQSNGVNLSALDVMTGLGPNAHRNMDQQTRFAVLWDKTYNISDKIRGYDGLNYTTSGVLRPFDIFKKIRIPVEQKTDQGGIASVINNSIHIIASTDHDVSSTTPGVSIEWSSRIRFNG